jgi:hypothetical protein
VITIDADGLHDTAEIPLSSSEYERTKADLIIGMREFARCLFHAV